MTATSDQLALHPLASLPDGTKADPLKLEPGGSYVVGRSSDADWQIPDPAISRRHAVIKQIGSQWYVTDLGSRHGSSINGRVLAEGEPVELNPGDRVRFGHWACRCRDSTRRSTGFSTHMDDDADVSQISRLGRERYTGLAQARLTALLETCKALAGASTLADVALAVTRAVHQGTGRQRVVVVRQLGPDEFETPAAPGRDPGFSISRSLVHAASEGAPVQLAGAPDLSHGQSIADLNIRSAVCAPIMVGDSPECYLYLDTRAGETGLDDEAAGFCSAVAQLGGFALEAIRRSELDQQRALLERELHAARRAQDLLMPRANSVVGRVRCSFGSRAGRLVAGDLFDLVPLEDGRVAFFLGDVSGKGVGAAVLMAATQATLRSALSRGASLPEALEHVTAYLHERSESGKFVTLLLGLIDTHAGTIELADAGHGLFCLCHPGRDPERPSIGGSYPLGIADRGGYTSTSLPCPPGARVVVFSDGVVEQMNAEGQEFGFDAALGVLARSASVERDVEALFQAVDTHARAPLADDVTIASIVIDAA